MPDTDDEPEDDGLERTAAAIALTQMFAHAGLSFAAFLEEHGEAGESLLDFAVINGAHVEDEEEELEDGPTDEELDAMPDVEPVGGRK